MVADKWPELPRRPQHVPVDEQLAYLLVRQALPRRLNVAGKPVNAQAAPYLLEKAHLACNRDDLAESHLAKHRLPVRLSSRPQAELVEDRVQLGGWRPCQRELIARDDAAASEHAVNFGQYPGYLAEGEH